MSELLDLWDYRRRVSEIYRRVRVGGGGEESWRGWRSERDRLFATHPQSPVPLERRRGFPGLPYFDYQPAWRMELEVEPLPGKEEELGHSGPGVTRFLPMGRVHLEGPAQGETLTLLWLDSYGGGVFLPFRDASNGSSTYGGGRYLLDTAKGADLGHQGRRVVLDFNFAYHPSCTFDHRWSCPLAPAENRLGVAVEAGERLGEAHI